MLKMQMSSLILTSEPDFSFYEQQLNHIWNWLIEKAGSILLALAFLWIGLRISKWLLRLIQRSFEKSKLDPTVRSFLNSVIHILLYVVVIITAISIMGIQVTSFVTLLGTVGVTIGLALQGSLSNLAGGVLILILKPFVIGDYILEDTHKNEGTVISIDIFYTRLRTFDGKVVVIPNGVLSNSSLTNLTKQEKRRLDLTIPVAYQTPVKQAKAILEEILRQEPLILQEEPIDIVLDAFGESSLEMVIHVWVKTENYWQAKWNVMEAIKEALDLAEIEIPYRKLDIYMKQ